MHIRDAEIDLETMRPHQAVREAEVQRKLSVGHVEEKATMKEMP